MSQIHNHIQRTLIFPTEGIDFESALLECFEKIGLHGKDTGGRLIQVTFFIEAYTNQDYSRMFEQIHKKAETCWAQQPAISIIAQAPASESLMSVELLTLPDAANDFHIAYKQVEGLNYTLVQHEGQQLLVAGGISANQVFIPFTQQVEKAYSILEAVLHAEGMDFGNITRQWNYVEDIVGVHETGQEHLQNYQVLNDIRSHYYAKSDFSNGYPAATGIGMNAGGLILEIFAMGDNHQECILPIKNPDQVDAYKYSEKVLVGDSYEGNQIKTTPKFERAKFIGKPERGVVFISGTASIKNEVTIGEDDVVRQTQVTVENIARLIQSENLKENGVNKLSVIPQYRYIRAYIKNKHDVKQVQAIISKHYGEIPVLYLVADVCRDNLLVELEGEAVIG
jgi:enamine deaminase RidA (YjgF/YER057c/UK114 family)